MSNSAANVNTGSLSSFRNDESVDFMVILFTHNDIEISYKIKKTQLLLIIADINDNIYYLS